jgi:two-component system cell cycle response regulator
LVGRFGGEEFMVLAPETWGESARVVAERLRLTVNKRTSEASAEQVTPVTVSIGVATTELELQRPDDLVKAADLALYQAKREGRNRVVLAS